MWRGGISQEGARWLPIRPRISFVGCSAAWDEGAALIHGIDAVTLGTREMAGAATARLAL